MHLSTMLVSPAHNSGRDDKKSGSYENIRYLSLLKRLNLVVRLTAKHNSLTDFFGMRIAAKKQKGTTMSEEIEKKIRALADIRAEATIGSYLSPFKAIERIQFLLSLIDELTEALFKMHALAQEKKQNDPNLDTHH